MLGEIEKFKGIENVEAKFSIVIPTWNNLAYLKICVGSILKNSAYKHQIIIHVNDGSDGTLEWVKKQLFDYTYSKENIGICYPLNYARTLVSTKYFVYMNDDMYVCPNWDKALLEALPVGRPFFYSSTMIEPLGTANNCVIQGNYGTCPENFKEEQLLREYAGLPFSDWSGATWPPNILPVDLWDLVGGYSTEFSPGAYSDPDFSMKLWQAGVRDFKGVAASRVYHFGCKTTGRILELNNGAKQFLEKWGMTAGTFTKYVLRRGEPYQGLLQEPNSSRYKVELKRGKIKKLFAMFGQ